LHVCVQNGVEYQNSITRETMDLIEVLLSLDPSKRPTASEALLHDYFWTTPLPADPKTCVQIYFHGYLCSSLSGIDCPSTKPHTSWIGEERRPLLLRHLIPISIRTNSKVLTARAVAHLTTSIVAVVVVDGECRWEGEEAHQYISSAHSTH
jgi:serine/threonine protein kinase